jgi:hypothetical protein
VTLCGQDRHLVEVWRSHGIPSDRATCEAALDIINKLDADLVEVWAIVDGLVDKLDAR